MARGVAPTDLAIQWDLPTELVTVEAWLPNPYGGFEPILATTAPLASWVHDVELTFDLCREPSAMRRTVSMNTSISPNVL